MHLHDDPDDIEYSTAMRLQTRQITDEQFHKFEGYAAEIFSAFGLDLNTPATKDTPRRFIKALFDITEGYDGDPKLLKVFGTECRGEPDCRLSQVVEGPISFFALCEHLLWPGLCRLHCSRKYHWDFKAHPSRAALLEAFCSAGTDRPPNCRCARNDAASSWRGRIFRS